MSTRATLLWLCLFAILALSHRALAQDPRGHVEAREQKGNNQIKGRKREAKREKKEKPATEPKNELEKLERIFDDAAKNNDKPNLKLFRAGTLWKGGCYEAAEPNHALLTGFAVTKVRPPGQEERVYCGSFRVQESDKVDRLAKTLVDQLNHAALNQQITHLSADEQSKRYHWRWLEGGGPKRSHELRLAEEGILVDRVLCEAREGCRLSDKVTVEYQKPIGYCSFKRPPPPKRAAVRKGPSPVIEGNSFPYKELEKDGKLVGMVVFGSNFASEHAEGIDKYLQFYADQGYEFDEEPTAAEDIPKELMDKIRNGSLDYLIKEAHWEGDDSDFLRLDSAGGILRGVRKREDGKEEVIYLVYPADEEDGEEESITNEELGEAVRERVEAGHGSFVYFNTSCYSGRENALNEVNAAGTPKLIVIASITRNDPLENAENNAPYQMLNGFLEHKSFAEIREAMKRDPYYARGEWEHFVFPDEPLYREHITDRAAPARPVKVTGRPRERDDEETVEAEEEEPGEVEIEEEGDDEMDIVDGGETTEFWDTFNEYTAHFNEGSYDEAGETLDTLSQMPKLTRAEKQRIALAHVYLGVARKNDQEAWSNLEEARKLSEGNDPELEIRSAYFYVYRRDYATAMTHARAAVAQSADYGDDEQAASIHANALYERAVCHFRLGNREASATDMRKALELSPALWDREDNDTIFQELQKLGYDLGEREDL